MAFTLSSRSELLLQPVGHAFAKAFQNLPRRLLQTLPGHFSSELNAVLRLFQIPPCGNTSQDVSRSCVNFNYMESVRKVVEHVAGALLAMYSVITIGSVYSPFRSY